MKNKFSREELKTFGQGFPDKGIFCNKCRTFIPQFEELTAQQEIRVLEIVKEGNSTLAIEELQQFTDCSIRFAKIWVIHKGKTHVPEVSHCPFCKKSLRTKEAKQCRFCLRDWHDENDLKFLK